MQRMVHRGGTLVLALGALVTGCGLIVPFVPERITRLFVDPLAGAVGRNIFTAVQVDPQSEDSAGPQIIATADLDGDGLLDVATAWNQSNPLQIHFQRRDALSGRVFFETITLSGDTPSVFIADLGIGDIDGDGNNDVVALVKNTGFFPRCLASGQFVEDEGALDGVVVVYFAPRDLTEANSALAWTEVFITQSDTAGAGPADLDMPEVGGYTDMELVDLDGVNGLDILVAWNPNECEGIGNGVDYFVNPGPTLARQESGWGQVTIAIDAPMVKSVTAFDVDRDGDLDVVYTFPEAGAQNVQWSRNPRIDIPDAFHVNDGTWQIGAVGEVRTGADIVTHGDIDGDGIMDVVVRSAGGRVIQWFRGPENPTTAPIRNIPWQVYTLAEFNDRMPQAIELGDLDGDGELELAASAGGAILWLDRFPGGSAFDQWEEFILTDDRPDSRPTTTDPNVNPNEIMVNDTLINNVKIVDLDGDGRADIIGTLNRQAQSGLTNDAVVWFRNNGL